MKYKLIANPIAGGGNVRRKWPLVARLLEKEGIVYDHEFTERRGHAEEIARRDVNRYDCIVSVGGDGTNQEIANGFFEDGRLINETTSFGVLPLGRGNDFSIHFKVPKLLEEAVAGLKHDERLIDAGLLEIEGKKRIFLNYVGTGFEAILSNEVQAGSKYISNGTILYFMKVFEILWKHKGNFPMKAVVDGRTIEGKFFFIDAFNTCCFGGGMRVAPDASAEDGMFDVVFAGDIGKLEVIKTLPKTYDGSHLPHPHIFVERGRHLRVEAGDPMLVCCSGEIQGKTPFDATILPRILKVRV
jgi:YegS/Rv2252/BmrU family lipid kinase